MVDDAQFIAELDVNVPAGTDLIADGDNEIRQVKIAVQQSFPNVGAAVNLTAAQLNGAAIKTEDNTFTGLNTFAQNVNVSERVLLNRVGPTTFPQVSWRDESSVSVWDLYMDSRVANPNDWRLDRRLAGVLQDTPISIRALNGFIDFDTASLAVPGRAMRFQTAAGDLPGESAVDVGMLFIGGSKTVRWDFFRRSDAAFGDLVMQRYDSNGTFQDTPFTISASTGRALFANQMLAADGSAAAPGVAMSSNSNMGMYWGGSNVLSFATAGINRCTMTGTEFQYFAAIRSSEASIATPGFASTAFPDTGITIDSGGDLDFVTAGVNRFFVRRNGNINMQFLPTSAAGLATGDLWNNSGFVAVA